MFTITHTAHRKCIENKLNIIFSLVVLTLKGLLKGIEYTKKFRGKGNIFSFNNKDFSAFATIVITFVV